MPENDPLSRPLHVTTWKGLHCKEKSGGVTTLRALAESIKERSAATKEGLRLLKLAEFGDVPTIKGYLRHNDNVKSISGIEADYDAGEYGFDWACEKARKANIAAVVYTSPSHSVDHPRWRILAPCSSDMEPADRDHLMGRLNGVFGGVFAGESWVLAQSYYYGHVEGRKADHRVELIEGEAIDLLHELDVLWIGKPNRAPRYDDSGAHIFQGMADRAPLSLDSCFDDIKSGRSYHASMLAIAAHYVGTGHSPDEVRSILRAAMEAVPSEMRDRRWQLRSGAKHIEPMLDWLTNRENRKLFRRYREAEEQDEAREEAAKSLENQAEGPSGRLLLSPAEFVAGFRPPAYLVDGILQRGYLYSLTARTGHGKTAVAMYMAQCIALGKPVHNRKVKGGAVLFLAGENPDDIRARFLTLGEHCGFDPRTIPVHFVNGVIDIEKSLDRIKKEAATIPELQLIIVDTAAAYFSGDETNSNAQQVSFARTLRRLTTELDTRPAVLVNCHPVKNAARDNLVPMGGSAFVNEMDGNLTLWSAEGSRVAELHWATKFRGPEFEPFSFRMDTVTCSHVVDEDGRLIPSVVACPIGDLEIEHAEAMAETDENKLLHVIAENPPLSIGELGKKVGWLLANGTPHKTKVVRVLERLADESPALIKRVRGKRYAVTDAGKKEHEKW